MVLGDIMTSIWPMCVLTSAIARFIPIFKLKYFWNAKTYTGEILIWCHIDGVLSEKPQNTHNVNCLFFNGCLGWNSKIAGMTVMLLKIVVHSLFSDALYGLRPNLAYTDPFWLICGGSICIKKTFFTIQDGITLSRKSIPEHKSVLHIKVSLVQRENIK